MNSFLRILSENANSGGFSSERVHTSLSREGVPCTDSTSIITHP